MSSSQSPPQSRSSSCHSVILIKLLLLLARLPSEWLLVCLSACPASKLLSLIIICGSRRASGGAAVPLQRERHWENQTAPQSTLEGDQFSIIIYFEEETTVQSSRNLLPPHVSQLLLAFSWNPSVICPLAIGPQTETLKMTQRAFSDSAAAAAMTERLLFETDQHSWQRFFLPLPPPSHLHGGSGYRRDTAYEFISHRVEAINVFHQQLRIAAKAAAVTVVTCRQGGAAVTAKATALLILLD